MRRKEFLNRWQARPAGEIPDGLILFDAVCVLCSGWVHFVLPRDHEGLFRFVAIQSEAGVALARHFGIDALDPQTIVVTAKGIAHFKGDAALAVLRDLPGWRWTGMFRAVPRVIRDFVYDLIARNRYRWWGRRQSCLMPTPQTRARFVSDPAEIPVLPAVRRGTPQPAVSTGS